jgi:hypothetical protein
MARFWITLAGGCVLLAAGRAIGGGPAPLDVQALAGRIDHYIDAGLAAAKVPPAPRADDAEFARRAYLDLVGRIPSVAEVRAFLDDRAADKRQRLVARLLEGPRFVTHFARVWRALLLPEANTNFQIRFQAPAFEAWLRKRIAANDGYDSLVRQILTMPIGDTPPRRGPAGNGESPVAFYTAKEVKPENLAAATSRLFLGFRLECAQCHNHPFASWKRDEFWGFAAFFAGVQRQGNADFAFPSREVADRREISIPGTERVVQATFPDGKEPRWKSKQTGRQALADWVTAADNPYFARAAANRVWAYFFGIGLVDPVDEMVGSEHVASHPELLDELARQLAMHKFDVKYLIRAITSSQAYQRSSARTHPGQEDPRRFARVALRGLSPEQLFDSIAEATGYRDANNRQVNFFGDGSARSQFLSLFANQAEKSTDVTTSILQALSLMNGQVTAEATNLEKSVTLAAVVDAPFMDTAERVETLVMATLSRRPTARESSRLVAFVDGGWAVASSAKPLSPQKRYERALADVFWALLNSGEFMLNH